MIAVNVLTTDFAEFVAPAWVSEVPMRPYLREAEDGEFVTVSDVNTDTPEGKAFWVWFDGVVLRDANAAWVAGDELDRNMFVNAERPF